MMKSRITDLIKSFSPRIHESTLEFLKNSAQCCHVHGYCGLLIRLPIPLNPDWNKRTPVTSAATQIHLKCGYKVDGQYLVVIAEFWQFAATSSEMFKPLEVMDAMKHITGALDANGAACVVHALFCGMWLCLKQIQETMKGKEMLSESLYGTQKIGAFKQVICI